MFWSKKEKNGNAAPAKAEKLPGPREIPGLVQNYLTKEKQMDSELVRIFKAVVRKKQGGGKVFDIRIFDGDDATANKVTVKNYTSFDEHPNLVIYEGWFDEGEKKVELAEKSKISQQPKLCSEDEIQQKIEGLHEPGDTVFFYMARGAGNGGPLGRGCVTVELTPEIPSKKCKKYTIYASDVVDMKPVGKGNRLFDMEKSKELAKWVKEGHCKRTFFG